MKYYAVYYRHGIKEKVTEYFNNLDELKNILDNNTTKEFLSDILNKINIHIVKESKFIEYLNKLIYIIYVSIDNNNNIIYSDKVSI